MIFTERWLWERKGEGEIQREGHRCKEREHRAEREGEVREGEGEGSGGIA